MGAFFSNLQVKIPAQESLSSRNLIDCIIKIYNDLGYETTENKKSADKSIIIASEKSTPWFSLYDYDFEENPKELTQIANVLSGMLNTDVMSTMVSDSDYLKISLYNKTKEIGNINNFNDNLSFTFSELDNWVQILAEGKTIEDISNIFNENEILVEKYLDHLAPLFEISPLYWKLGYNYFEEIIPNKGTKLYFTKKEKEQKETPSETNLVFSVYGSDYNLKIGEPHPISFQISNTGLSTKDIEIIMVGDAIEQEMIKPSDIRINEIQKEISFLETISTDNRKLWVAQLSEINIPEGKPLPPNHSMKEYRRYMEQMYKSAIILNFEVEGIKPGKTSFSIFAIPLPRGCGQSAYAEIAFTIE